MCELSIDNFKGNSEHMLHKNDETMIGLSQFKNWHATLKYFCKCSCAVIFYQLKHQMKIKKRNMNMKNMREKTIFGIVSFYYPSA